MAFELFELVKKKKKTNFSSKGSSDKLHSMHVVPDWNALWGVISLY